MKDRNTNRIGYIDIAKGIGIIAVLIGHTYESILSTVAWSFHMPLFFMASGLTFKYRTQEECVKNNIRRLFLPYAFTICLVITIAFIINPFGSDWLKWLWGGYMAVDMASQSLFLYKV